MKTKYLFTALCGLFILYSCTKDDSDQSAGFPQELVYDGQRYELADAFVTHHPESGSGQAHNLDLALLSKGVGLLLDANNLPMGVSGNGYALFFEGYSSDSTRYPSGSYEMDSTKKAFSFREGYLYSVENGNISILSPIQTGSFEVIEESGQYTLVGEGKDTAGLRFNFSYQGSIAWYQDEGWSHSRG